MDVTPTNETPKRPRTKVVVKAPAAKKSPRKTLTVRKKAATPAAGTEVSKPRAAMDLQTEIAKAAFYLAAEREFAPGHDLDDWLEAERRVKALYAI